MTSVGSGAFSGALDPRAAPAIMRASQAMTRTLSRRQLQAAIAAALMAAGCGDGTHLTPGPGCPDLTREFPLFSGDAGASAGDAAAPPADGSVSTETCGVHCPATVPSSTGGEAYLASCAPADASVGPRVSCRYSVPCPGGRAAEGDSPVAPADASAGALLAAIARMEAGSVGAFAHLARELRAHRAPAPLQGAARRAMRDERRHARAMSSLAQRYGALPTAAGRTARGVRELEAVARENAIEGCVREAWGAVVASWQARHAEDPRVRVVMIRVAREETEHAALAWRVARWAEGRLSPAARARVEEARREAVEALCEGVAIDQPGASTERALGWPRPEQSRAMVAALRAGVWAA